MAESPAPFGDFNPGSIPLRREEGSHEAFLPLDGEGRFFPDETLSRAQVLELVFWCLDPDWELEGRPLSQWTAKEALASLGLTKPLSSQTSVVTRYEFYAMLELLCGSLEVDAQFEDVLPESSLYPTFQTAVGSGWLADGPDVYAYPNKSLTRRDAARALNQILGRSGDDARRSELVGTIPDVSPEDPDFWAIAEASVSHEFEPSEHWLNSSPAPVRQPGFFFLDGRLHAIDEQGAPVVGKEYAGLRFNTAGEQTSGDAELDELVRDTLVQIADFEHMQVSFRVDEYDIGDVSIGERVTVTATATEKEFVSKVETINYISSSQGNVAYYTATANVDVDGGVYPGMQVTVTIPQEEAVDVVVLKADALSFNLENQAFVYYKDENDALQQKNVEVGVSNGNYVEIRSGLSSGDKVYAVSKTSEDSLNTMFASMFGQQQFNQPGGNRQNGGQGNWNRDRNNSGSGTNSNRQAPSGGNSGGNGGGR